MTSAAKTWISVCSLCLPERFVAARAGARGEKVGSRRCELFSKFIARK